MGTIVNELANGVTAFRAEIPCEAAYPGLPIWNYGSKTPDNRSPIYKTPAYLWITGCRPGDLLDVNFTLQCNNNTISNVECSGELLIKPWNEAAPKWDPTKVQAATSGPYTYENCKSISLNVGTNITPDIHHGLVVRRTPYIVTPDDPPDFYLIARWYAGSDDLRVQGQILTILPYSTDLFAIRHRAAF